MCKKVKVPSKREKWVEVAVWKLLENKKGRGHKVHGLSFRLERWEEEPELNSPSLVVFEFFGILDDFVACNLQPFFLTLLGEYG